MARWTITVDVTEEGELLLSALSRRQGDGTIRYVLSNAAQDGIDALVAKLTAEWEREHPKVKP